MLNDDDDDDDVKCNATAFSLEFVSQVLQYQTVVLYPAPLNVGL